MWMARPAAHAIAVSSSSYPKLFTSALNEMLGDLRCQAGQLAVRRKRNPLYLPMMIANESHVAKEAPQILPTGKFAGMDHQSLQVTMRFDPRVCGERQRVEILRAQGLLDLDHDHAGFGKKAVRNRGAFGKRPQPADGPVKFLIAEYRTGHGMRNPASRVILGSRPSQ